MADALADWYDRHVIEQAKADAAFAAAIRAKADEDFANFCNLDAEHQLAAYMNMTMLNSSTWLTRPESHKARNEGIERRRRYIVNRMIAGS